MELTQREKSWIVVALLILVPALFIRFGLIPLSRYSQQQRSAVSRVEARIHQVERLGQRLKHLERTRSSQSSSLSKRVDLMLRQNRLRTRSRTIVDTGTDNRQRLVLKLDEVNLTELVKILYAIENASPVIVIRNIEINRAFRNKKRFRVSTALSSW